MQRIKKQTHGSLEWLEVRHRDELGKVTFGASEAPALMNVSQYQNLMDLCLQKLEPPVLRPASEAMRKGIIFEEPLGYEAASILGVQVRQPGEMFRKGRFTVTLDFWTPDEKLIIECKVTNQYSVTTGQDLPLPWLMQGHVQHWVTGAEVWFSVFDKYQQISVVRMPVDQAIIDALIRQSETIGNDLDRGIIPDEAWIDANAEQIAKLHPVNPDEVVECDDELLLLVTELRNLKADEKKNDERQTWVKAEIAKRMKSARAIDSNGDHILTWNEQKGRTTLDQQALKEEHPDIYEAYLKQGAPFRVMRVGKML